MKSLTKAIKQEMDIDWDALDGKTVRIVSSGELAFEATYTLSYNEVGPKNFSSSWVEPGSSTFLYEMLHEAWYGASAGIEIIIDEGVPLLVNADSEGNDPDSIPVGSVVLLESKKGDLKLAYRGTKRFIFFAYKVGERFYAWCGTVETSATRGPSSPYKVISYIAPEDLIQTLTTEPTDEGAEVTSNTVHITSPDSFEAMGQRINEMITHSFSKSFKGDL